MGRNFSDGNAEPWSDRDFEPISRYLFEEMKLELAPHRLELLRARLQAQLQATGDRCFSTFHDAISRDGAEGSAAQLLIDLSTINHTSFFREPASLRFLAERLVERLRGGQLSVRVWSAGSSTGQEPYSLAMLMSELLDSFIGRRLQCWASDLSLGVLRRAAAAIYDERQLAGVGEERLRRFFLKGRGSQAGNWRVVPEIRSLVSFHRLDLRRSQWNVPGEFDAILCRNVLIYFEESERPALIDRLSNRLLEGGWLVIGQGEIAPDRPGRLEKVAPAVFRKIAGARPADSAAVPPARPSSIPRSRVEAAVLIVDDSKTARSRIREALEIEPRFRLLEAVDPFDAAEVMRKVVPRALVLDVEMPKMDGLTFLRILMKQHPLPVVLCTSQVERGLTGLELGALDVIPKPNWTAPEEFSAWAVRMLEGVRHAVSCRSKSEPEDASILPSRPSPGESGIFAAGEGKHSADAILPKRPFNPRSAPTEPIVLLGASTGGVQTLHRLLAAIPKESPGIVIVQHLPKDFTAAFAARLNDNPAIGAEVSEAKNGDRVERGTVRVIPGDFHGLIRRAGDGYKIELAKGPAVNRFRPSVDVLFRSAAQAAGPRALGVLLTGMLDDGADGLREMRDEGAMTIAQNEATSIVFGMPREAIRRNAARLILPLDDIPGAIVDWSRR